MKYFIDWDHGSVLWLEGDTLVFSPILKDGSFDTEEAGDVDFFNMEKKEAERLRSIKAQLASQKS